MPPLPDQGAAASEGRMQRDVAAMGSKTYDLLVVGGGITGACVARDAARRGLSVALVEKADFSHATSAASSKLIHGGLRYLRNFEIGLVRESLRERRVWEMIAPHMVDPLPMLLPVYDRPGQPGRFVLRAGLTIYDVLGYDRNRLEDEDKKIPGHSSLSREQALELEPIIDPEGLTGAVVYYDCQMYSPERLALECLVDASDHGADIANYAEVASLVMDHERVVGARVRDLEDDTQVEIAAKLVVNASGPWADHLLGSLPGQSEPMQIVRSKGIHVITRALTRTHAVIADDPNAGHFFLVPWRGHTLIGTTDTKFTAQPDDFEVTQADIDEFLQVVNQGFPAAALTRDDVLHFYGGLRPLVDDPSDEGDDGTYNASRRSEVCDHARDDGVEGLISAIGGKWTTSRNLAEQVVDVVGRKLSVRLPPCETALRPLPAGDVGRFADFASAARETYPRFPQAVVDNLSRNYGGRIGDVVALVDTDPALGQPVATGRVELAAVVVFAVRNEMARRLDDVVLRRTGMGTLGPVAEATLRSVASLMAAELGWDDARQREEIARVRARYQPG